MAKTAERKMNSNQKLGLRLLQVSKLKPWVGNPRRNEGAIDAVSRSIGRFGFNVPILCDEDYNIIAGHTRLRAALELGIDKVPAIVLRLKGREKQAFAIADNKTAQLAEWEHCSLKGLLAEIKEGGIDLGDLGFFDTDLRRLFVEENADEDDVGAVPDVPVTRPGDLVCLGEHRLLCGSSCDLELVRDLVGRNQLDHVFAGPPCFNQRGLGDWEDVCSYNRDMEKVMRSCRRWLSEGGIMVWHIGNACTEHRDLTSEHSRLLSKVGFRYLDTIAYVKTTANYGTPRCKHIRQSGRYYPAFQWEALLVFQKPGEMPHMTPEAILYMSEHHTNVWSVGSVGQRLAHPAVCPVEVPYRCLQAYTRPDAYVLDPFGGSGTTLIAAQKAGRRALLMERNPAFCDVTVNRWETLTGQKARRG